MPTKSNHIKRAKLNEDFVASILSLEKKYKYWIITAYNYSAIHWIDAYLAQIPYHPRSHSIRESCITRDSKLKGKIYYEYCELKNLCRGSRYELIVIGQVDINNAINYHQSIKSHIQKII